MEDINEVNEVKQKLVNYGFSLVTISWLIAIVIGVIFPLFSQNFIANQIVNLSSPLPVNINDGTSESNSLTMLLSSLVLFILGSLYVMAIGSQVFLIAKTQKLSMIWSFSLTILGPVFIWLILPYLILFFFSM